MTSVQTIVVGRLMLGIANLAGCGAAGLVPVDGTVTLDDQPLVGATIAMQHVDS